MPDLTDRPFCLFVTSFVAMWVAARIGCSLLRKTYALEEQVREDFGFILPASLTLLGIIVGFSFSMATNRYDQRKNYEEAEANAIGTEYLRADLLPTGDATKLRQLLRNYLEQRITFYSTQDAQEVEQVNSRTAQLQSQLWSAVVPAAQAQPTPVIALVAQGMNDVLNSQGYTQSAWWYRIPAAAWTLMITIAIGCNVLVGYGSRGARSSSKLLLILPLLISVAFMLISDIDAPRRGLIRVQAQNLTSLAESLHAQ